MLLLLCQNSHYFDKQTNKKIIKIEKISNHNFPSSPCCQPNLGELNLLLPGIKVFIFSQLKSCLFA